MKWFACKCIEREDQEYIHEELKVGFVCKLVYMDMYI